MASSLGRRSRSVLRRFLEAPHLVEAVRALPPVALGTVVAAVGVEDAGEIVALATTEQLVHLFDEDVFDDETVDPARFAVWLEVMLEAGDAFTADRVAELPEDLVTAAVNGFARVLDLDALAVEIADCADLTDANDLLEAARTEELLGYLLVVRRAEGWDAVWTTLVSLAERHADHVERLLSRLREATMDRVREEGLYELLSSEEQLLEDAAADREERRAPAGWVSPSDARAFLALARDGIGDPDARDAITTAWLRRLGPEPEPATTTSVDLEAVLDRLGLSSHPPRLAARASTTDPASRLRAAMERLATADPELHRARMDELAFLANALSADATMTDRHRRAVEAAEEAVRVSGQALVARSRAAENDLRVLTARPLDLLFREGYRRRRNMG